MKGSLAVGLAGAICIAAATVAVAQENSLDAEPVKNDRITPEERARKEVRTIGPMAVRLFGQLEYEYSDNLFLDRAGDPQKTQGSSLIGTVGADFDYRNSRLDAYGTFQIARDFGLFGADDSNVTQQYADATGRLQIVRGQVYIDFEGQLIQALSSDFAPFSLAPVPGRDAFDTFGRVALTPTARKRLGTWGAVETSLTYDRAGPTSSDPNDPLDQTIIPRVRFYTLRPIGDFAFESEAFYKHLDSTSDIDDQERVTVLFEPTYYLSPKFALRGRFGYDDIDSPAFSEDADGPFALVGFAYSPNRRLDIELLGGVRYSEPNVDLSIRYRVGDWGLAGIRAYQDIVSGSESLFRRELNSILREEYGVLTGKAPERTVVTIESILSRFNSENNIGLGSSPRAYRSSLISAYAGFDLRRSQFLFTTTGETRQFDIIDLDNRSLYFSLSWTYNFSNRLSSVVEGIYRIEETDNISLSNTDTWSTKLELNYQLSKNVDVSASYTYAQRSATFSFDEYDQNAIVLGLSAEF